MKSLSFFLRTFLVSCAVIMSVCHADAQRVVATGAGVTGGPRVTGRASPGLGIVFNQFVFEDSFRGGAAVAFADINKDGVEDLVTAAGKSGGPRVRILDGRFLRSNQLVSMADFFVGDPNDRTGLSVGAGDINGDGFADVVVGWDSGAPYSGNVLAFNGANLVGNQAVKFFEQSLFSGVGAEVAVGDINADGFGDIIIGAGNGGAPRLRVISGERARFNQVAGFFDQFVFDTNLRGGIHVGAGDVNADGRADVIVAPGVGGGPVVTVYNGISVSQNQPGAMFNQFVFDPNIRGGVYVGGGDFNGDGYADIAVGNGPTNGGIVRVLNGANAASNGVVSLADFQPYEPNFIGGIWVAIGNMSLAQCSDGIDNDGDGAVDLNDFSCQGQPGRNDEFNPRAQCQDGADNDGDGAVDYTADFSCQGNPQRNDEATPKAQCQDGVDNDSDGAIDYLADFSCQGNPQRNDESTPRAQCQDGIDNDGDGAIDLNDFSCQGNKQKNDESTPKAQCQDGIDNDGDGAVDLADFSCQGNPQKNDESRPLAQCQDGKDNDADGFFDVADPGCENNPQKNNEENPVPQCSDKVDNDNDGAVDLNDFSCQGNPQKNDESTPKAQCQDGVDNDGDSLVDLADPGCLGNPQRNSEVNAPPQCSDGIDNDKDGAVDFPADFSCENTLDNDESNPKSQCQDGKDNDKDGLVDLLDPGCTDRQDNDEKNTKPQCSDGIDNDGDGAIDLDDFSCGGDAQKNDESTPKAQCQDTIDNDGDGKIDALDPDCTGQQDNNEAGGAPGCIDEITVTITQQLDEIALQLATLANQAADQLFQDAKRQSGDVAAAQRDVKRSKARAQEYLTQARTLTLQIPNISRTCPNLPPVCKEVSNAATIAALKTVELESGNHVARVLNRSGFRRSNQTRRYQAFIKEARRLVSVGYGQLSQLPPTAVSCTQ